MSPFKIFLLMVLAEGIYMSCQSKTCIKVHRVLSTFCHVIVEKTPLISGLVVSSGSALMRKCLENRLNRKQNNKDAQW